MISTQMLKGTLEGCILGIIRKRETYGYEISEALGQYGFGKITEGTIYPILLRLEKNGMIRATYRRSEAQVLFTDGRWGDGVSVFSDKLPGIIRRCRCPACRCEGRK